MPGHAKGAYLTSTLSLAFAENGASLLAGCGPYLHVASSCVSMSLLKVSAMLRTDTAQTILVFPVSTYADPLACGTKPVFKTVASKYTLLVCCLATAGRGKWPYRLAGLLQAFFRHCERPRKIAREQARLCSRRVYENSFLDLGNAVDLVQTWL